MSEREPVPLLSVRHTRSLDPGFSMLATLDPLFSMLATLAGGREFERATYESLDG
jgi:hypothetical protein